MKVSTFTRYIQCGELRRDVPSLIARQHRVALSIISLRVYQLSLDRLIGFRSIQLIIHQN